MKKSRAGIHIRKGNSSDQQSLKELLAFHQMETDVDPSEFYVAETNGKLLGAVRLEWPAADHAYLRPIAVVSREKGRGIGRALLEKIFLECSRVSVVARGEAVPFYLRLGFIPIDWETVPDSYRRECELCEERKQCRAVPMSLGKNKNKE